MTVIGAHPEFFFGFALGMLAAGFVFWKTVRDSWDRERRLHDARLAESQQYERALGEHKASEATMVERCANLRGLIELKEKA